MSSLGYNVFLAAFAALVATSLPAASLSVLDFARDPDMSRMQLSPDGTYESFLHPDSGQLAVCCRPVGSTRATLFDVGDTTVLGGRVYKGVADYRWISNERLLLTTTVWNEIFGDLATNRDGSHVQGISDLESLPVTEGMLVNVNVDGLLWGTRVIHAFKDAAGTVLLLDEHAGSGTVRLYPDVVRVDTMAGTSSTVVKNPGNVIAWRADANGVVRLGLTDFGDLHFGFIYRASGEKSWGKLNLPDLHAPQLQAFDADERHLYVTALSAHNRLALFRTAIDETAGVGLSEVVFQDPDYDIDSEPMTQTPRFDGHLLDQVMFSPRTHALLGVRYLREGPVTQWLDPTFKSFQSAVDHAMPHTVNLCIGISDDEKRLLFLCYSDRDPGTYCVLDAAHKSITPAGRRMPWIDPAQMAQMFPIAYTARDGTKIHGFLTVPRNAQPKLLPLVVLPHGGPWDRDVWGFNPLVQFLASRGYAVLQMNYRGSIGYGETFYELGRQQIGGKIQDDIEDGTRWAIAAGLADPNRVAILGQSYGGYSALFALGHSPGLYRCGVSIAGVTDWVRIFHVLDVDEYKEAREYWKQNVGDLATDEPRLRRVSPVAFADRITAPLLVIQGSDDRTVPPAQARALIAALKAAGHEPQTLFLSNDGHGLTSVAARREAYEAIEHFLAVHLAETKPSTGR